MRHDKERMLAEIQAVRATGEDTEYKTAWCNGAELALLAVGQEEQTMMGVTWNNTLSHIGGMK